MTRRQYSLIIATMGLSYCAMTPGAMADTVPPAAATSAPSVNSAAAPATDSADWPDVSTRIKELVKKYYPKAHVEVTDRSVHFEYNVKQLEGYYGDSIVPQPGGILGDITLKNGDPAIDVGAPQLTKDGSNATTKLSLDPHSYKSHAHLVTELTYPTKESGEFKDKFSTIISSFKCEAPAAAPVTVVPPAPQAQVPAPAQAQAQPPADTAGPLRAERKLIQDMIAQVKDSGENVSNYTAVQKYIEDRAHAGATEAELRPTAEHLINELSDVCLGKIKDPITLQHEAASSKSTAQPASNSSAKTGGNGGKSAAQQYIDETKKANKQKENEYKKGMSKEYWQKFHDEMHKPKT